MPVTTEFANPTTREYVEALGHLDVSGLELTAQRPFSHDDRKVWRQPSDDKPHITQTGYLLGAVYYDSYFRHGFVVVSEDEFGYVTCVDVNDDLSLATLTPRHHCTRLDRRHHHLRRLPTRQVTLIY